MCWTQERMKADGGRKMGNLKEENGKMTMIQFSFKMDMAVLPKYVLFFIFILTTAKKQPLASQK